MSKHTPRPWLIHPHVDVEYSIFNQFGTVHIGDITTEADAKLIAASPELYDVLKGLVDRGEIMSDTKEIKSLLNRIDNE